MTKQHKLHIVFNVEQPKKVKKGMDVEEMNKAKETLKTFLLI